MNFKHLHYFWQVASCGSLTRAAERLHATPQTLSGQIKLLEERFGKPLFRKEGRQLALTETGELVRGYAEEIFTLGAELEELLNAEGPEGMPMEFRVGVSDALPKSMVLKLLKPVLQLDLPVRLVCREWQVDRLFSELAVHRLDVVISDAPVPAGMSVKAYNHRLGSSPQAFFASAELAAQCAATPFPQCLHGMPMLALGQDSAVREQLERWLKRHDLRPRIVGEFDDSGLMKAFGREGRGIFMAPSVLADDICMRYDVQRIGDTTEIEQRYYAISVQRRITHPCTEAIARAAREGLFTFAATPT